MDIIIVMPLGKVSRQDINAAQQTINSQHGIGRARNFGLVRGDQLNHPLKTDKVNTKKR